MNKFNVQKQMIETVAKALDELIDQVVFIGGCTTGLLVTDSFTQEQIRYTDDVDLIIDIASNAQWIALQQKLRDKGFTESMEDDVICRFRLGELKVDFMPTDENILGFSNRWYPEAISKAVDYQLTENLIIKLISPEYFVATKLEAYHGRGNGDILGSHDLEDLLNIFDGRSGIIIDIKTAEEGVKEYIRNELASLQEENDFEYLVKATANNDTAREELIFQRIETCLND